MGVSSKSRDKRELIGLVKANHKVHSGYLDSSSVCSAPPCGGGGSAADNEQIKRRGAVYYDSRKMERPSVHGCGESFLGGAC